MGRSSKSVSKNRHPTSYSLRDTVRVDAAARRFFFRSASVTASFDRTRPSDAGTAPGSRLEPDCLPNLPENRRALLQKVRLRELPGRRGPVAVEVVGLLDVVRHRRRRLGRRHGCRRRASSASFASMSCVIVLSSLRAARRVNAWRRAGTTNAVAVAMAAAA